MCCSRIFKKIVFKNEMCFLSDTAVMYFRSLNNLGIAKVLSFASPLIGHIFVLKGHQVIQLKSTKNP